MTYEDLEKDHLKVEDDNNNDNDIENQSLANLDQHLDNEDDELDALNLSTAISKDFIKKFKHRSKKDQERID